MIKIGHGVIVEDFGFDLIFAFRRFEISKKTGGRKNSCRLQMLSGLSGISFESISTLGTSKRTRGHSYKIIKNRFNTDLRQDFFSERVIRPNFRNSLDDGNASATSLDIFKQRLKPQRHTDGSTTGHLMFARGDLTGGHSCSGRRGPWEAGPWRPPGLGGAGRLNFGLQLQSPDCNLNWIYDLLKLETRTLIRRPVLSEF